MARIERQWLRPGKHANGHGDGDSPSKRLIRGRDEQRQRQRQSQRPSQNMLARTATRASRSLAHRAFSASATALTRSPPSNPPPPHDSTTHFGFRNVPEPEKENLVRGVFSSVASSYDVMNDAMSFGIHRLWKDHYVSKLDPQGGLKCLDVAGGTGDIAMRILDHARTKHGDRDTSVAMLDINPEMLQEGKKRFAQTMYHNTPQVSFHLGNAEHLSDFADNTFDQYTIAFGIRNCTHVDRVLKEAHRVLKPGGVFSCLEFSHVENPILAKAYDLWSFQVIPPLGHILA
ncbi:hypothetical protein JCM3774_005829 [Rhodotorula dairenensis]